jgi:hypothetical protein
MVSSAGRGSRRTSVPSDGPDSSCRSSVLVASVLGATPGDEPDAIKYQISSAVADDDQVNGVFGPRVSDPAAQAVVVGLRPDGPPGRPAGDVPVRRPTDRSRWDRCCAHLPTPGGVDLTDPAVVTDLGQWSSVSGSTGASSDTQRLRNCRTRGVHRRRPCGARSRSIIPTTRLTGSPTTCAHIGTTRSNCPLRNGRPV